MPVMVLYKDKTISDVIIVEICSELADVTQKLLNAKIEVRAIEPTFMFNANDLHIEMKFRDFGDWSDQQLVDYHKAVMAALGQILSRLPDPRAYSFYIIPTPTPRSIWAQGATKNNTKGS